MTDSRIADAVDGACKRAGLERSNLTKVILLHSNQVTLSLSQTCRVFLSIEPTPPSPRNSATSVAWTLWCASTFTPAAERSRQGPGGIGRHVLPAWTGSAP
jgi:hypothetical protein